MTITRVANTGQHPSALPAHDPWNILVVRAVSDNGTGVQRLLLAGSDRTYTFEVAETGAAALRAIGTTGPAPDCAVLDFHLPDMNAIELLASLTDANGVARCAVVVLTGTAGTEMGREALRAGAHDYVGIEWLSPPSLTRAVENAIERWAMARDLQRRQAALRLSEQHFQALSTASQDISYRMSADWSVMLPLDGRALVRSTRAPLEHWAWMHQNLPADEHPRVREAIAAAIAQKHLFELEHRVLRPDGTSGWTLSRAVPILNAHGDVLEWFGAASDITARRSIAGALMRSEALARSVVESSADCVQGLSLEGRLLWMNENGRRQLEACDFAALPGSDWASFWDAGGIRAEAETAMVAARTGGVGRFSGYALTVAGTPRWWDVAVTAIPGPDGQVEQLLSVARDVTEQREAEEAFRLSTLRMELAVKCSSVVLFQQDRDLRYTWIYNPALGFNGADVIGKTDRDLMEREADAGVAEAVKREVIRTGVGQRRDVVVYHTGAPLYFHLCVEPLCDAVGMITGITCAAIDITDLKVVEQTLADQDVRKDEFLATLSHELRNPLAPIVNGVAVLRTARDPRLADRTHNMIDRQLGHLVHLVDDLLDVSRMRSGKIVLRSERVMMREVVEAAIEACRPLVDAQRHALVVELPHDSLIVVGDETRLVQVVSNLLINAAKYSEPGGRITVAVARAGDDVVVRVDDTGMGIAASSLPTLWDMFSQVRETLSKAQGGLGIGLSLVKRLVELHGGTVHAESPGVGGGSTFTVRLPLAADNTVGIAASAPPIPAPPLLVAVPPLNRRRVLVVDDNRDTADSLAMLLERSGNETRTAYNGAEAVETAAVFRPQVVLLDIGLPTIDGYEAARQIREQPWGAAMVLVALTGWGQDEHRQQSKAAGFNAHLVKPVNLTALSKLLAEWAPTA